MPGKTKSEDIILVVSRMDPMATAEILESSLSRWQKRGYKKSRVLRSVADDEKIRHVALVKKIDAQREALKKAVLQSAGGAGLVSVMLGNGAVDIDSIVAKAVPVGNEPPGTAKPRTADGESLTSIVDPDGAGKDGAGDAGSDTGKESVAIASVEGVSESAVAALASEGLTTLEGIRKLDEGALANVPGLKKKDREAVEAAANENPNQG